jgi:hypothetical protein
MSILNELLDAIEVHRASHHTVFEALARCKLPPEKLARFLHEMGAFCEASRQGGEMAKTLWQAGLVKASETVEAIIASEAGHGEQFAQMARILLHGSPYTARNWADFRSALVSAETIRAQTSFLERQNTSLESALFSLGVLLVVELAANRQIIPGEVHAFTGCGHYGLHIGQVPYLAEHAGEGGAEHDHERAILEAVASVYEVGQLRTVRAGCEEFLDVLAAFYDRLLAIVVE